MHFNDAILEYGFDCRARKLSDKTISNYQKQLRYFDWEYRIQEWLYQYFYEDCMSYVFDAVFGEEC